MDVQTDAEFDADMAYLYSLVDALFEYGGHDLQRIAQDMRETK